MKFIYSPFAILGKSIDASDYQKMNLIFEDFWRKERDNQLTLKKSV